MSHIVVGERIAGAAPHIIGHIIAGAGHFVESAGGLFQTGAMHMPAIPIIAQSAVNDLSTPIAAERWQWQRMNGQYGSGALIAAAEVESDAANRALRESVDRSFENMLDAAQDAGMAILSAAAGDPQSAVDYAAKAAEKYVNGVLKDFGLNGGWNQQVYQGTMGPPDNGR